MPSQNQSTGTSDAITSRGIGAEGVLKVRLRSLSGHAYRSSIARSPDVL